MNPEIEITDRRAIEAVENVTTFAPELDPTGELNKQWLKEHPNHVLNQKKSLLVIEHGLTAFIL